LECSYYDPDQGWGPVLNANIITEGKGAGDSCSGKWDKLYYRGEIFSATHNLNVYYEYNLDSQYDPIISAAKSLLQQLESSNVATPCSSSEDSSSTGDTKDTSIPTTQPKLEPVSPTDDATKDSRCPEKYVYVEKIGMCRFDAPVDTRCPEGYVYLEEHGVCAALIKVPAKNLTPLSELNDFDEILDEGKRLAEQDQNYDKAVLYFKKAIQVEPENARAYYNIAETLFNYLDKKDSVEYYKKLLEIIPTHTTAKNRLKSMNIDLTDETGKSDAVKEVFKQPKEFQEQIKAEKELADFKEEYSIQIQLGNEFFMESAFDKAIFAYDNAILTDPLDPTAYFLKADALFHSGDWESAAEYFYIYRMFDPDQQMAKERLQSMGFPLEHHMVLTKEYREFYENMVNSLDAEFIELHTDNQLKQLDEIFAKFDKDYSAQLEFEYAMEDWEEMSKRMDERQLELKRLENLANSRSIIELVPEWIKNTAKWWSEDQIDDSDFVGGIQYMIKEEIINVPDLPAQASQTSKEKVPDWVRNNAGWWADGLISEDDFVNGIKWLVENGIVRV